MYKVYTSGKMSGLSFKQQMEWRLKLENFCKGNNRNLEFFHPPYYYNYDHKYHKTEKEIKEFELNRLRESDILVVNLDDINNSIGTHFEIAFANAINSFGNKHIYILGFGENANIHPWILDSFIRIENNLDDLCHYILEYFI